MQTQLKKIIFKNKLFFFQIINLIVMIVTFLFFINSFSYADQKKIQEEYSINENPSNLVSIDNNGVNYKYTMDINASIHTLSEFIRDEDKVIKISPSLKDKRILEKISTRKRIDLDHIEMIWPLKDRYLIYLAREVYSNEFQALFTMNSINYFYEDASKVLGTMKNGRIYLVAMGFKKNITRATVEITLDPGGWIPNWIMKRYSGNWAYLFLRNLSNEVFVS
ncbi:MAG: hypothetical protein HOJ35_03735 [Bdellovibrionales bacterium]|nr:hypothetical protein [Bdellovibrionales bacterium]